jgi:iron complex transport system ATP-binding protein
MSEPAITGDEVVFRYGQHTAVETSSFQIPSGTITALIGPNGAGKSTLLNGIAGLLEPAAGDLEVLPIGERPRTTSYVLQGTKVNDALPVTVREVVTMGRYAGKGAFRSLTDTDRAVVDSAMERMGITSLANNHLSQLSGGQRQRAFVAQGLAQDHDVLLLDEPVTGLDIISAQVIDDVMHDEQSHGCTVVMTTHSLAEARVADHVLLLSGRVVASGTPEEVLKIEHLTEAYGASLLHVDGERLFIDDPHHTPTAGRHTHERSIHVQSDPGELHGR